MVFAEREPVVRAMDSIVESNNQNGTSRLLITGGSGFVGRILVKFFASRFAVFATHFEDVAPSDLGAPVFHLDIRDGEAVSRVFVSVKPNLVIHAAGNKDVRFCEKHPDDAYQTNASGTQNVARACRDVGARMIYLSTDLVFASLEGNYKESDLPQPSLIYGRSKLEGERKAQEELTDVAICRSAGIYGPRSPLLRWLSAELKAGKRVECFTDVFNSPTYGENLGEMIDAIIHKQLTGIFHTAGRERVSRYEFFKSYASTFGLNLDLISPVSIGAHKDSLLLQPDSSLSVEETAGKLDIPFNSVAEGFRRLKASGGI